MCNFTGKLTAWLDGELAVNEAADVEQHLQLCAECRSSVEARRQVSSAFDAYCDAYREAAKAPRPGRNLPRRVPVVSGVAAVAAALAALFLLAPRAHVQLSPAATPVPIAGTAVDSQPIPAVRAAQPSPSIRAIPRIEPGKRLGQMRHAASQPQGEEINRLPLGPAVEIAIPADAIFPPGSIPEGVGFTADVTIAPDGSAQQIRLRPQLAEFERRSTRP